MTVQDTIAKSDAVETLRAKGAAFVDNVIEPAKDEVAHAAARAKTAAGDAARNMQRRAGEMGDAAIERGGEMAADLSDATARNLKSAESGMREFARRNPVLLMAGAAVLGMGVAAWLGQKAIRNK